MPDEAEQLARRDRLMKQMQLRMTPEERMARAWAMQEAAMRELESNPEGYERFIRRNFRQRAVQGPNHE